MLSLELPGAARLESDTPDDEPPSADLGLPEEFLAPSRSVTLRGVDGNVAPTPVRPSSDLAEESNDGRDGWTRSRTSATVPPPPRPRSDRPPSQSTAPESIDSLRLVSHARVAPAFDLATDMHDRFALGDFTGALHAAELVLGRCPDNAEATEVARNAKERLEALHVARLGGVDAVLARTVADSEIRWLGLDHRAAFLLSHVDGRTSVEEIIDLAGMPRHDALRLLVELLERGALARLG